MNTTLTLHPDADIDALKARLQAMGLWTRLQRDTQGRPAALTLLAHSTRVPDPVLLDLPGVVDLLRPPSPHPKLDALRGQSVVLCRQEVRVTTGDGHAPVQGGPHLRRRADCCVG